jgi:hypothetical protein
MKGIGERDQKTFGPALVTDKQAVWRDHDGTETTLNLPEAMALYLRFGEIVHWMLLRDGENRG